MHLVSYSHTNKDGSGFGRFTLVGRFPANNDDVLEIEKWVVDENKDRWPDMKVVVLNVTPLRRWWQFWK